jgi:drug/metabolite transporter (DMT)-like permease
MSYSHGIVASTFSIFLLAGSASSEVCNVSDAGSPPDFLSLMQQTIPRVVALSGTGAPRVTGLMEEGASVKIGGAMNAMEARLENYATDLVAVLDDAPQRKKVLWGGTIAVIVYFIVVIFGTSPGKVSNDADRSLRHSVVPAMCWMAFSFTLSIFNKWVMIPDGANFPHPITVCVGHMLTTTVVLWLMRFAKPALFPGLVSIPADLMRTLALSVFAVGALGAFSFTFSNFSVKHLSVALINMLKAANPCYALILAVLLGTMDSKGSMWQVSFASILMFGGAMITCYGEVGVSWFGLVCFIGGVFAEQVRLVLLKTLVSGNNFQWDPLSTVAVVSPIALVVLVIPAAAIEGPHLPLSRLASDAQLQQALLMNGLIAVALNVSYVRLLDVISPVTFTVCGVGKDIVTAFASLFIVGGTITPLQVCVKC